MTTSAPLPREQQSPYSLAGRPAIVTGAGRGIGRAIALRLVQAGAPVCLAARSAPELEETARMAGDLGGEAISVPCDLTEEGSVEALIEAAVGRFGGLSVLVNNAGGAHRLRNLDELDERTFELGTALNYTSVYRTMRAAAPHLFAAAPHAAVLNIVSIAARRSMPSMSYYSGAKAAVVAMSRTAAREWGPHGVRVNCLGPGWIATDLSRPLIESESFASSTLPEVPLQRWGTAEDIAEAAGFLVSDAARYITGETLYVDGGLLA